RGRYGSVYLVENRARTRALKVFNNKISWDDYEKKDDNNIENSVNVIPVSDSVHMINNFQSPYMVDIIDYGETVMGQSCVLMEYMPLSLEQAITKEGKFNEYKACLYFTEILKGLQFQEIYNIIHRDIKPANLFIFADTIKAGDHSFISISAMSTGAKDMSEAFGTPAYSAPEVFDTYYSHSADRWAAAVIFFQMITGQLPFKGETVLKIMAAIINNSPDYTLIPEKYRGFLEKCFQKNPRDRHPDVENMIAEFEACLISDHITSEIKPEHPVLSSISQLIRPAPESPEDKISAGEGISTIGDKSSAENKVSVQKINRIWKLRKEPITVHEDESKKIFELDDKGHPLEYVQNRYEVSAKGTITDNATGLMWQQSGSNINFPYAAALSYIDMLNNECFAGYSDWRIPTIAELLSLLEPEKANGYLHISSLFDNKQQWCWSSDKRTKSSGWYVFFYSGNVNWDFFDLDNYVRGVRL
ncbi:MAG: DUF1566 domain-containing protein, partial [Desulfamplus sp.]|nr:DUF1566 domain-containing protein [Desulfamplus sp.]